MSIFKYLALTFFIFCLTPVSLASSDKSSEKEFNVGEMIMHHIKDAHEWHLWGSEHGGKSIYLPVILIDGELKVFSSENFYHGEPAMAIDHKTHQTVSYIKGKDKAEGYAMFHEKIYKLNNGELSFEDGHVHGNSKPLDFSITKNVLSLFFGAAIILIMMLLYSLLIQTSL